MPAVELRFHKPAANPTPNGEGLVIVIHADPRGTAALGPGGDAGYSGITPSSALELDPLDNGATDDDPNHLSHIWDGGIVRSHSNVSTPMTSGGSFYVWVNYDATDFYSIYHSSTTSRPLNRNVGGLDDLARLGSSQLYIGIVAGTSTTAAEAHDILRWHLAIE